MLQTTKIYKITKIQKKPIDAQYIFLSVAAVKKYIA